MVSEIARDKLTSSFVWRIDFAKIFSDILDISAYAKLKPKKEAKHDEVKYKDNKSLWNDIINNKHYEGEYLSLNEFHLTEWIPLSPGTYYLPESESRRKSAKRNFYDEKRKEYNPRGKENMVFGGLGSLRLSSKNIYSKKCFFLGASSNGITHEGIPIAFKDDDYKKLIKNIKEAGGCLSNISGSL